jgi:ribonuclease D
LNRRELGILNELAILRDRLARERNIPLKYVMPDDVLIGLVALRPHALDELGQLRRLDNGIKKHHGAAIIDAIARGESLGDDELPARAPRPLGMQREALVSTMAVFVNAIAAENDLPTTLLLGRNALERIARDTPASAHDIAATLNLTPWRQALIVDPLWELLTGERVIRVADYRSGNPRTTFVRTTPAGRADDQD